MKEIYNASFYFAEGDARHTFYVRPFVDDLKADLDRLVIDAKKVSGDTTVTESNGTYIVSTSEDVSGPKFATSFWGMLFRRFLAESKQVRYDEENDEKYYIAIFSPRFIEPCSRQLVA